MAPGTGRGAGGTAPSRAPARVRPAAALAGLVLAALLPGAARATEADCAAITAAMQALGAAEQFHSLLTVQTPGRRRPVRQERFVLGDVVYANSPAAGRWVKLPMTAAERQALGAGLVAYPPQDCHEEAGGEIGGAAVRLYSFRQVLPGTGEGSSSEAPGRLWVAAADGRPRRYEGQHGEVQVTLTIDYDGVAPPYGQ
ncbi:hypothetical protein [Roseicella frigidaeris]|uniref:Uncharacterized protein n=1 Tax=Roseicella frigidaeris TaxID=2230885 RepID=A0A327M8G5_9PROT|nr:hypothetical protein [Roseicella frigidaeris]RAI59009.1 hypothetical protein DOO78_10725 [Roseicella frigidaeris]